MIERDRDKVGSQFTWRGRNEASTFSGFCSYHDTKLFQEIDATDSDDLPNRAIVLHTLRAVAREYWVNLNELQSTDWVLRELKAENYSRLAERLGAVTVEDVKSARMGIVYQSLRLKLAEAVGHQAKLFGSLHHQVESGKYHLTEKATVYLDGPPKVGASVVANPEFDFHSRRIANLQYVGFSPTLVLTVVPQTGRSALTITHHKKERNALGVLPVQLREMPESERRRVLSWFLVIHGENVAFAPSFVEALPVGLRQRIESVFHNTLYSAISYEGLPPLDLF